MRRPMVLALAFIVAGCSPGTGDGSTTSERVATTSTVAPATTITTGSSTTSTTIPPSTTSTTLSLDDTTLAYAEVAAVDFPVQMTARPGEELSYLITKDGRLWAVDGAAIAEQPVLDIRDQVHDEGERGLLSIALHPSDATRFYLHYSDNNGDTTVSEFTLISPTEADPSSERILLRVDQPAGNHNGGMLQFTPAGSLLLGLGDGGGADDRFGNGQNPDTLLAGLVEIGVEGDPQPIKYSTGLRNPWRFWIDGELVYVADVGQNLFEEVSVVPLEPGHNFGWPIAEGLHCFNSPAGCDTSGQVIPVIEIRHGEAGTCSISGGIVYRGQAVPQLNGHYFYSDYCGGYLRSLLFADGAATDLRDWTSQVGVAGMVTGFGIDGEGEMYVTTTDRLLEVVPAG